MRVLVIGAGIVGASVAYHLAVRGVDVEVADRGDRGQATSAGAGIVGPWLSANEDPDWYRFASAGARYYPELAAVLAEDGEPDLGFTRVGGMVVEQDPAVLDAVADRLARRAAADPVGEVSRLGPGEARALFPALHERWAAVHATGVSRVDGRRVRDVLLRAAVRHGARRREGLARLGEPVDVTVVAAGAWSAELVPALPVSPQRGQISHLRLSGVDTDRWPVVQAPRHHYLLAFPDSRVVAGATRETGAGFEHRVTVAGQAQVLTEALHVAPGLAAAELLETRVGFRPASDTGLPVLGRVGDVVVATGMGATGLTVGPYAGELAARLAVGEDPGLDLAAYSPDLAR
ncbi:FAD-dependent oxidoreductase [Kutzneria viridogrisea]|uniref:D-amino-acid dehydrogenase n=1 Tax=Kutzneria viridogrisea TaxID=47990 RepID=A0ABR6BDM0_9PSEU|nr:D-amino-acid dehydrogenase [Kutzneria viridogrisea]